jgi:hypothetical protein
LLRPRLLQGLLIVLVLRMQMLELPGAMIDLSLRRYDLLLHGCGVDRAGFLLQFLQLLLIALLLFPDCRDAGQQDFMLLALIGTVTLLRIDFLLLLSAALLQLLEFVVEPGTVLLLRL